MLVVTQDMAGQHGLGHRGEHLLRAFIIRVYMADTS
jgi:hypothetical protein